MQSGSGHHPSFFRKGWIRPRAHKEKQLESTKVLPAITTTSVACDIGPGVNTLRAQLICRSKPNFCNLFEFSATKFTEKEIPSTPLALKIVK